MLKGQGMPDVRSGRRGSLRVLVNVVVPRGLSGDQRKLVEELDGALSATNYGEPPDEGFLGRLRRFGGG
jgi:molecular chaperone DnaJ